MSLFISQALSASADSFQNIPLTDANAFIYAYKSKLGGMVITDYIRQSPRVNIPETLEGEPVVGVDLSKCEKELVVLILPDCVKKFALSKTIKETLGYIKVPKDNIIEAGLFEGYSSLSNIACGDKLYDCIEDINIFELCLPDEDLPLPIDDFEHLKMEDGVVTGVIGEPTDIVIPFGVTEIGEKAFRDCRSLKSVVIPKSVNVIKSEAFCGCDSLSSVDISNSVTAIYSYAFASCTALTSIHIPDSVKEIRYRIFASCSILKKVTIGNGITRIEDGAFELCHADVIYKGKVYTQANIDDLYKAINGG